MSVLSILLNQINKLHNLILTNFSLARESNIRTNKLCIYQNVRRVKNCDKNRT